MLILSVQKGNNEPEIHVYDNTPENNRQIINRIKRIYDDRKKEIYYSNLKLTSSIKTELHEKILQLSGVTTADRFGLLENMNNVLKSFLDSHKLSDIPETIKVNITHFE